MNREEKDLLATFVIDQLYAGRTDQQIRRFLSDRHLSFGSLFVSYGLRCCVGGVAFTIFGERGPLPELWIFFAGVNPEADHISTLVEGYLNDPGMRRNNGCNAEASRDADQFWYRASRALPWRQIPSRVWGHSGGGIVAECLVRQRFAAPDSVIVALTSFGAPKPGYQGATVESDLLERRRYMNQNDPVPLIPSLAAPDGSSIALVLLNRSTGRIADPRPWACVHGSGGLRIGGGAPAAAVEPRCDLSYVDQLRSWIAKEPASLRAHSLEGYRSALLQIINQQNIAPQNLVGGGAQPPPEVNLVMPIDIREVNLVMPLQVVPIVPRQAGGFNREALVGSFRELQAMAISRLPKELQFRRVRMIDGWKVEFMGRIVADCPTQSKARILAKWGNKFLRTMNNGSFIHNVSMVASFADWFAAASQALGGNPPHVRITGT